MRPAPVAVVIGRFALPSRAELRLLEEALRRGERVVVVLGSSFHARTPRDPLGWRERAEMVRLCLPEAERERVRFVPVRDYFDDARWVAAVQAAVAQEAPPAQARWRLVCRDGRAARRYEAWFTRWEVEPVPLPATPDVARLRCLFLLRGGARPEAPLTERRDAALAVLASWMPAPAIEYLRAWSVLPWYAELVADQHALDEERDRWAGAPYEPIFCTVDAVVRCAGHVLLVKRSTRPGCGLWALPGGFVEPSERLADAAMRELREETGLGLHEALLRQALDRVVVFDHPARSLRGRTITHAHGFDLRLDRLPEVKAGDDAAAAEWVPVTRLCDLEDSLFEDHFHILDEFLRLT